MTRFQRSTRILVTLCLLIMQVQVWASETLGCRLEARLLSGDSTACPLHQAIGSQPTQTNPSCLLDCQRCALLCLAGVPALLASAPVLPRLDSVQIADPTPGRHFYRFTPDSPLRPPIG